jgi:hypothetical protein
LKKPGGKPANPPDVPDSRGLQAIQASKAKEFRRYRKLSSIMWAKVLSIMPANAGLVTPD